MKVAIIQPGFLPWLGFFDLLYRCDIFVYYDDVQFDLHGWRNRNRIKTISGAMWLTVPVIHSGKHGQKILNVEIDNTKNWKKKIMHSIYQNYTKAPYVELLFPELEKIMHKNYVKLVDLNYEFAELMMEWFGIKRLIYYSSKLDIYGDRSGRILNICKLFSANTYISGNAAQDYLDIELLKNNGIDVEWQNFNHPVYPQLHGEFIPYLSGLDFLMNIGPQKYLGNNWR